MLALFALIAAPIPLVFVAAACAWVGAERAARLLERRRRRRERNRKTGPPK